MGKEAAVSLNEKQFVLQALREGFRLDGRKPLDYRSISIRLNNQQRGLADVQIGKTRCVIESRDGYELINVECLLVLRAR